MTPGAASSHRLTVCGVRLSYRQSMNLLRRLAAVVSSGVPPATALRSMVSAGRRGSMATIARYLMQSIEQGHSLGDAMGRCPRSFSPLAVALVQAGEMRGELPESMEEAADIAERNLTLVRRIQLAMIYPALVMIVGLGVAWFLVSFVVPRFADLFLDLDVELPLVTRALLRAAEVGRVALPVAFLCMVAIAILLPALRRTLPGRVIGDWLLLHIPVVASLHRRLVSQRFAQAYGRLAAAGVPIERALQMSGAATGNTIAEQVVLNAIASVRRGHPLSDGLAPHGIFVAELREDIVSGERSGQIDVILIRLAEQLDRQVQQAITALLIIPQVVIIVVLGAFVLWIALAILVPWFSLPSIIGRGM